MLIKSPTKKAFKENLGKEIAAGKPPEQAAAIAHRVQRDARNQQRRGNSRGR